MFVCTFIDARSSHARWRKHSNDPKKIPNVFHERLQVCQQSGCGGGRNWNVCLLVRQALHEPFAPQTSCEIVTGFTLPKSSSEYFIRPRLCHMDQSMCLHMRSQYEFTYKTSQIHAASVSVKQILLWTLCPKHLLSAHVATPTCSWARAAKHWYFTGTRISCICTFLSHSGHETDLRVP